MLSLHGTIPLFINKCFWKRQEIIQTINKSDLDAFIEANIQDYHGKILRRLRQLKLNTVLKRKNPYLFKAKSIATAHDLVKSILDAHLSSQEEAIFGTFLERLIIFLRENLWR